MSAMSQKLQKLLARQKLAGIYHLPHSDCKTLKQATLALHFGWLQADFGESRGSARCSKDRQGSACPTGMEPTTTPSRIASPISRGTPPRAMSYSSAAPMNCTPRRSGLRDPQ